MQIRKAASEMQEHFCSLGHLRCSDSWLNTGLLLWKWLITACIPEEEPSAGTPAPEQATTKHRPTSRQTN